MSNASCLSGFTSADYSTTGIPENIEHYIIYPHPWVEEGSSRASNIADPA
jgi:hypothetical protein